MSEYRSIESLVRAARANELAKRLLSHGASTQTIMDLTGWKRSRVTRLRRRFAVPEGVSHRGSQNSLAFFLRTPSSRAQCAVGTKF
jgi:hypothetical protein